MSKIVAIIPAKGTSSRFPGKNTAEINGKSLLSIAINVLTNWGRCNEIYVNSDADSILELAKLNNAIPYKRDKSLAAGNVSSIDVVKEQITSLNFNADTIIMIVQVTCPLRSENDLNEGFNLFVSNGNKSQVVSVTEYEKPPELALMLDEDGKLIRKYPEKFNIITQTHPISYKYNTCFLINNVKGILDQHDTIGKNSIPYIMSPQTSIDIDYKYQLELVESLSKK